eukprot:6462048-Amphidinium_carterae.2
MQQPSVKSDKPCTSFAPHKTSVSPCTGLVQEVLQYIPSVAAPFGSRPPLRNSLQNSSGAICGSLFVSAKDVSSCSAKLWKREEKHEEQATCNSKVVFLEEAASDP